MTVGVFIAGSTASGVSVRKLDDAGSVVWSNSGSSTANCAAAGNGFFYAGIGSDVVKFDASGSVVWTYAHGDTVRAVAVDASDNVYIGGNVGTGTKTHRKLDSSGSAVWSGNHGDVVRAIAVDGSGNVYIGGNLISSKTHRKLNSSGTEVWSGNHGDTVYAIAVDGSGNVYIAGWAVSTDSARTHRKLNSSGTVQWSGIHGNTLFAVAVDGSGNVYIGGSSGTSGKTHRKLNSSGTEQWSGDHGNSVNALAVDSDGNVYIAGGSGTSTKTHRKLNSSGTEQWAQYHGNTLRGIALYAMGTTTLAPGLPIKLAMGVPASVLFASPPGLPIKLALGLPTAPDAPVPPLGDGQTVYRCYLTGLPALAELAIQSLQCRKRQSASTWLRITAISGSLAIIATLAAAKSAGGQLVIYAGLRDSAGAETMGEMLRATLTDYGYEHSSGALLITLEARVAAVLDPLQTRLMTGISSRSDEDGRRQIRCAVHPRLRPGDTVDTGSETWTAHSITYFIGVNQAYMDVQEELL